MGKETGCNERVPNHRVNYRGRCHLSILLCIMYRFTLLIHTFVLCISCALSAPPTALISALLTPSAAAAAGASSLSSATQQKPQTGLTTYDQKQSGKYNIHLNIKDVAIIALDAGHVDGGVGDFQEDYYEDYDLSDFTVKPIFGLIDIASDKPSSTTAAPPLIHSEPDNNDDDDDEDVATSSSEETTNKSNAITEPIIKDPINKTQSVTILSENTAPALSISTNGTPSTSGIMVTTSTPAPEDLPPKLTLADIANVQLSAPKPSSENRPPITLSDLVNAQKPSSLSLSQFVPSAQKPFPTKPGEIPVQIILEPAHKDLSRQRPNTDWRFRNRIRATPSANRRITPPHDAAIGNNKHRKNYYANRRNCVLDQNGQCQNSNRRFSSPTL